MRLTTVVPPGGFVVTRLGLMGVLVATAIGCAMSPSGTFAQNSGTEAEQDACTPDVFRLCEAYIPNEGPIVACLKLNRVRLSNACAQVFFSANAQATAPTRMHKHRHHRRQ